MLDFLEVAAKQVLIAFSNLLLIGLLFVLLAVLVKGKEVLNQARSAMASGAFNLGWMGLNLLLLMPVAGGLYAFFYSYPIGLIDRSFWYALPEPVVIFAAIFLGDFIGYWRHRFEHSRILWPSHRVHHTDEHMTWLTLQRFHPVNFFTTMIIDTSFLILMGIPPYAVVANNMVRNYYGYFIHADLPWTYGKWSRVFVSPAMHRWHHAANPNAYHTNFATVFSIFDRAFGTYRVPGACDEPLGVKDSFGKSFAAELLHPFNPKAYSVKKRPKVTQASK